MTTDHKIIETYNEKCDYKIIELYNRECDYKYITESVGCKPGYAEAIVAIYIINTLRSMWLDTDMSQAQIAAKLRVAPSYVYELIARWFTVEERIARKSRVQRMVQTDERVAPPPWYTGPGRSVPLKVIEYCEVMDITCIPPGMSVVLISQGVFALMTKAEAKELSQARSILVGGDNEHPEQGYYQSETDA